MKRLLVANRGEIALRIVRAARDLGMPARSATAAPLAARKEYKTRIGRLREALA